MTGSASHRDLAQRKAHAQIHPSFGVELQAGRDSGLHPNQSLCQQSMTLLSETTLQPMLYKPLRRA